MLAFFKDLTRYIHFTTFVLQKFPSDHNGDKYNPQSCHFSLVCKIYLCVYMCREYQSLDPKNLPDYSSHAFSGAFGLLFSKNNPVSPPVTPAKSLSKPRGLSEGHCVEAIIREVPSGSPVPQRALPKLALWIPPLKDFLITTYVRSSDFSPLTCR